MEEYLDGFNFYRVSILGEKTTLLTIGTYRPKETVYDLFRGIEDFEESEVDVWELSAADLKQSRLMVPIFCVELRMEYKNLEELIKDLMIWRLAGMMDKEMEGMK